MKVAAAVVEFTGHGYAGAGVRQIAEPAGMSAMVINRCFGSKEGLFTQAVDRAFAPPTVVGGERTGSAGAVAHALAERTASGAERLDPFLLLLLLRSARITGGGRSPVGVVEPGAGRGRATSLADALGTAGRPATGCQVSHRPCRRASSIP